METTHPEWLLWIIAVLTTVGMGDPDSGSSMLLSLYGEKSGSGLPEGCLPPVKQFDHQGRRRYEGVELWEVTPSSMPEVAMLHLMFIGSEGKTMIFSEEPHAINRTFEVLFKPLVKKSGPNMLKENNIKSKQRHNNIQEYLSGEYERLNPLVTGYHRNEFNTYEQILEHLKRLTMMCADNIKCSLKTIGKSREDRDIVVFKIVPQGNTRRPVIWIDSTRSAHNWLAASTVVEMIQMFVEKSKSNEEVKKLVGSFEWVFLPVANPDGYEYAWHKDRFHSKTRSPTSDPDCTGVDLDRNFDYKITDNSYRKYKECLDFHNGSEQEPETAAMLAEMAEQEDAILVWLNVKQGPWRITLPQSRCNDDSEQMTEATKAVLESKTLQKPWTLDENCNCIYKGAGKAMDYLYSNSLAKYVLTLELGGSTFDVTASDIPESTREIQRFLLALTTNITELGKNRVHDEM